MLWISITNTVQRGPIWDNCTRYGSHIDQYSCTYRNQLNSLQSHFRYPDALSCYKNALKFNPRQFRFLWARYRNFYSKTHFAAFRTACLKKVGGEIVGKSRNQIHPGVRAVTYLCLYVSNMCPQCGVFLVHQ